MPSWSARQGGTQAWEGRCLAGLAAIVLAAVSVALAALAACPALAAEPESYTYEVTPLLSPFNTYIYVSTENPDPESFRLTDKQSTYASDSSDGGGAFSVVTRTFADVKYEKEATHRVAGGYILSGTGASDGGELVLQKRSGSGYVDTRVKVSCPALVDKVDYLINTYTKDKTGLTNQLDAVYSNLALIALYPHDIVDSTKSGTWPYPCLSVSAYTDVTMLVEHFEDMYASADMDLLSSKLYPYVLDSAGFPSMMRQVALRLDPNCTVRTGTTHSSVVINGKTYQGQGSSGRDPFYLSDIKRDYTFTGTGFGSAGGADLSSIATVLKAYATEATEHASTARAKVSQDAVKKVVGQGAWLRVRQEGSSGTTYAYVNANGLPYADVWVDGRYVSAWHHWVSGATFSDHAQASVLVHGKTYTQNGKTTVGDVLYSYDSGSDCWRSDVTSETLTATQVSGMVSGTSTGLAPENGYIYDGESEPGTPFTTTHLQSFSLPSETTVYVGKTVTVTPTVLPSGACATIKSVSNSNYSVATVGIQGDSVLVEGLSVGTTTLTIRALDGGLTATTKVHVVNDIAEMDVSTSGGATWTGSPIKPTVRVSYYAYGYYLRYLQEGTDYDVSYENNIGPSESRGDARITITGKGDYTGSKTVTFSIARVNIGYWAKEVTIDAIPDQAWTGQSVEPDVTIHVGDKILKRGVDYDLAYSSNIDPGVASIAISGKGVAQGQRTVYFCIVKQSTDDASQQQGSGQDSSSDGQQGSSSQGSNTSQGSSSQSPQATGGSGQTPSSGSADGTGTSNGGGPSPSQPTDGGTMYRLFNQWSGEHLFTMDAAERDQLVSIGWQDEGAAWGVPTSGDPVYRLYNRYSGDHFYTGSLSEYEQLASIGWSQEGVSFLSGGDTSIYRLFNQWLTQGTHLFTTDKSEYDDLVQRGWQGEGVAFRGIGA